MKRVFLKRIFVYLSAVYFLIGGVGFNVVNYCCQTCAGEGIEEIATSSCFSVHHHIRNIDSHQKHNDLFCSDINQHSDNCRFLRVNTDIPSFHSKLLLHSGLKYAINLFNAVNLFLADKDGAIIQCNIPPPERLLSPSGRSILTSNAVLII